MKNILYQFILCLAVLLANSPTSAEAPQLSLANNYRADINISQYWISEKLDGVRAYWDGHQLLTRQGNTIHAPSWFLKQLPPEPLDGELWLGRGMFEKTVSIVRTLKPVDDQWRQIHYMIFDLPASQLAFEQRLVHLQKLLIDKESVVQLIPHRQVSSHTELHQALQNVLQRQGEGLMLHRADSLYRHGRHNDLLKLKPYTDAEAVVIDHKAGQGKYSGLMGSLLVKSQQGQLFYIGSGFSDQQRQNPPAVGAVISFRYNGFTAKGIPRHARFLRVRTDHNF